jgi:hypothetical protein
MHGQNVTVAAMQERTLTVLPSMGMPGGTKGTEPVAMMMLRAVTVPPTSTRPGTIFNDWSGSGPSLTFGSIFIQGPAYFSNAIVKLHFSCHNPLAF